MLGCNVRTASTELIISCKDKVSVKKVAIEYGLEVPVEFLCPITKEVMSQPLMTKTGQNFERGAIIQKFQQGIEKCPVTGRALNPSDLVPNNSLEVQIEKWIWTNGLPEPPKANLNQEVFGIFSPRKKKQHETFIRAIMKRMENSSI